MRIFVLILMALVGYSHADITQTFTIESVGVSDNSGTIFVNVVEQIPNVQCNVSNQFKVDLNNRIADKFYSTALMALASDRQLTILYEPSVCVGSSTKANVVFVKN